MQRSRKIILVTLAVLTVLYLATILALPGLVRSQASAWVAEHTTRTLRIGAIHINPLTFSIRVDRFALSEAGSNETFVAFERLSLSPAVWRSLTQQALVLEELTLEKPSLRVALDENGEVNVADLKPPSDPPLEQSPTAEPPLFAVGNLHVIDGSLDLLDARRPETAHRIRAFNLALPFVGNTPGVVDDFITPRLDFELDGAPVVAVSELKPFADRLEARLQLELNNIEIPYYSPYLPHDRPFTIDSGKLALRIDVNYAVESDGAVKVLVSGDSTLTGMRVRDSLGEVLFFLPMVRVDLARADPLAQSAVVREVVFYSPEIFVSRDADGTWNHARLAPPERGDDAEPATPDGATPPPQVSVERLQVHTGTIHFSDLSGRGAFRRDIRDLHLDLEGFSTSGEPATFSLDAWVSERFITPVGKVHVQGSVGIAPFTFAAGLRTREVALAGLENYLPPEISLRIDEGNLDTDLQLLLADEKGTLHGSVDGSLGVRALAISEPRTATGVLGWESLQLDRIDLRLAPGVPRLHIGEVALSGYLARIVVTKDGQVNLQQVRGTETVAEETPSPAGSAGDAGDSGEPPPSPLDLRIDELVLQGGELDFQDRHLARPFSTVLYNLGGRVSGLSNVAGERAELDLRGSLDNHAPLRISGTLQPLAGPLFLDIDSRLDTMELTPLTPYTTTYLGYPVTRGMLYLDLEYRIDGEELHAANRVFVDQFTLGEHQPGDQATRLPVKLAIALLRDANGEIHLNLPVEGKLDDPQFSIFGVVLQILKNLLIKAATSPLALLSSLVGSGEDFSTIDFAPGRSALSAGEQQKLEALAQALVQRPALKLEVRGHVDREIDPEAWRHAELERRLQRLKFDQLPRARRTELGDPAQVTIEAQEYPRYLQQAYRAADFPKPRNVFGLTKRLPDEEAEKLLLANMTAGEAEMEQLARERAVAVRDYLVEEAGMPPERVFLNMQQIDLPPEKGEPAQRVSFGVATD